MAKIITEEGNLFVKFKDEPKFFLPNSLVEKLKKLNRESISFITECNNKKEEFEVDIKELKSQKRGTRRAGAFSKRIDDNQQIKDISSSLKVVGKFSIKELGDMSYDLKIDKSEECKREEEKQREEEREVTPAPPPPPPEESRSTPLKEEEKPKREENSSSNAKYWIITLIGAIILIIILLIIKFYPKNDNLIAQKEPPKKVQIEPTPKEKPKPKPEPKVEKREKEVEKPIKIEEPQKEEAKKVVEKPKEIIHKNVTIYPAISFTYQYDRDLDTYVESNQQKVNGFVGYAEIKIENGEYSIDNGKWQKNPSKIKSGQKIKVRHKTSLKPNSITETILTIGGNEIIFQSTTKR